MGNKRTKKAISLEGLKANKLTGKAILSHTIGGLCAGISANWIFKFIMLIL